MGRRNKRKPKPEPVAYVRGATWKDVMSGKPVTVAEVRKQGKRKGKPAPYTRLVKCRLCGDTERVAKHEFLRAASPRCPKCGVIMDPVHVGQTPKPVAKAEPGTPPGAATVAVRKAAVLTCKHCGRRRPAGELRCAGCASPWVRLRSKP